MRVGASTRLGSGMTRPIRGQLPRPLLDQCFSMHSGIGTCKNTYLYVIIIIIVIVKLSNHDVHATYNKQTEKEVQIKKRN